MNLCPNILIKFFMLSKMFLKFFLLGSNPLIWACNIACNAYIIYVTKSPSQNINYHSFGTLNRLSQESLNDRLRCIYFFYATMTLFFLHCTSKHSFFISLKNNQKWLHILKLYHEIWRKHFCLTFLKALSLYFSFWKLHFSFKKD